MVDEAKYTKLRMYIETYYDIQKVRIIEGNRIEDLVRRNVLSKTDADELHHMTEKRLSATEKDISKAVTVIVDRDPIWQEWLSEVNGIGHTLAGGLMAYIGDISRFANISKLWAYAGLSVVQRCSECQKRLFTDELRKKDWIKHTFDRLKAINERSTKKEKKSDDDLMKKAEDMTCDCFKPTPVMERDRRRAGELSDFNPRLKTHAWKIGESFVKNKGAYRAMYDRFKAEEKAKNPDLTDGHIHARAKRKTVKLFLSHYWLIARKQAGLDTRSPYAIDHLEHQHFIGPLIDGPDNIAGEL
jgi:hypothetical protein